MSDDRDCTVLTRSDHTLSRLSACAAAAVVTAVALALTAPATPAAAAAAPSWSSEFNGANGSAPDAAQWSRVTGGGGWGNGDLETYTASNRNSVVQNGKLLITARRETKTGTDGVPRDYTSARLSTQGRFAMQYGRVQARIKVPAGAGLFPAFWMLGDDVGTVGWPQSGEFDMMENIGSLPKTLVAGFHGPNMTRSSGSTTYRTAAPLADAYHVYAMDWQPDSVSWSFDGHVFATKTRTDLPKGATWVFDHPFFLLLNVAVGGDWPGTPPATTRFPASMSVDWVRVYA